MKKLIAVIIVAIVIVGGAYWLSGMIKGGYSSPAPVNSGSDNPSTTPENTLSTKGPFGITSDATGQYLTDKAGLTLYVNLADENASGKINPTCNATCEKTWLPYLLPSNEAAPGQSSDSLLSRVNLFKRADGKTQFALGTKPLYRYVGDVKMGDMAGASISSWAVARP